jgi:NitT/TauT family transport system substrate-binding protein
MKLLRLLPILLLLTIASGCSDRAPLTLAIHTWIGYESFYLGHQFGRLPEQVSLLEGRIAGDSLNALIDGRADAACLTLDEVLYARAKGVPLSVITILDISSGADAVVARESIGSITEISGKRIGVELSAVGGLMLTHLLERAGLTRDQVTVVEIAPSEQVEAWQQRAIDVAITYEPTTSLLQREGAGLIFDSRQLPETILDVLAVRSDRISGREGTLRELVASHFAAIEYLRINRSDAIYRIAARQQIKPDEIMQALAGVTLPDQNANRGYLSEESPLNRVVDGIARVMIDGGQIENKPATDGLFDSRFLPTREVESL